MRFNVVFALAAFLSICNLSTAQTKEVKVGHVFSIVVPNYMNKTSGLNSAASIQFKNSVKEVYSIVVEDAKEDLKLSEIAYADAKEFFDEFMKDLMKDEEKPVASKEIIKKVGTTTVVEADLKLHDKESKSDIYYLVGVVETQGYYYKVLSWTTAENKDKYKADFQKILYSLKD